VRRTAEYIFLSHKISEEIMKKLHSLQITEFIKNRRNWKHHVERTSADMIPPPPPKF
jgi:hypothetical protein